MAGSGQDAFPAFLLDTSIIIAILNNDPTVIQRLYDVRTATSIIVVGELFFGARISNQTEAEFDKINDFLAHTSVLDCDFSVSWYYARIKYDLRRRGTPIPDNDMWIAATAEWYQLPLISRDEHFDRIPGFNHQRW